MSLSPTDVGHRVVVRRVLGDPDAVRPQYGDVLGELIELDAERQRVVVRTATGDTVAVAVADVVAAKRIPPRPPGSLPVADLELERIAALGWRGLDTATLGDWQLRAAGGWTGRANSVLPLGDPGMPLDAALDVVRDWYSARDLPPTVQLPLPACDELRRALEERGWSDRWGALVLVASVRALRAARLAVPGLPPVTVAAEPDDAWLAAYHYRGDALPAVALDVLRNAAAPGFAAVRLDGVPVAICRLVVDEGWMGITALEVDPAHRRRGLATHLLAGTVEYAAGQGARGVYLQVDSDNTGAVAMYEKLGFRHHHTYRYYRP
ncbi:GNAT family N-acetyltransferase [Cryptosporangium aurantiacum]|uniref:Acetyltransferase (GNAT) family protein n=1 Tax=Cryptosporangium aurantiacum TaxID=134849 RepID=A0A1M7QQ74_9ACTN|nr:GNAT family N-acetyltransferase [Cryptosporangium aurantiacum]SHN33685.1 Acetyltransferase (GNAT) family protein [Cryptosporangium aurantiacum]